MTSSYKKHYPKSFSSYGNPHYGSHKKVHPKAHSESYSTLLEELSHPKLGEREFNGRVKFWLENYSDRLEFMLSKFLEIIEKRHFSAFHLFRAMMNYRIKHKLRLIYDENSFWTWFWKIISAQKDSVRLEGLKILGYLTADQLQNMYNETQANCLENLKRLANVQAKNINVIRLSLNCIGNILTHSNYKITFDSTELFLSLIKILESLPSYKDSEGQFNVRLLVALFRVMNCLHVDVQSLPVQDLDFLINQLIKYIYIGTHSFPVPLTTFEHKPAVNPKHQTSSYNDLSNSSSDLSETTDIEECKREAEICAKIRNYCATCLSNLIKQDCNLPSQRLIRLLPCKVFSSELQRLLVDIKEPYLCIGNTLLEGVKGREECLAILRKDLNESDLLSLLIFEENNKARLSFCKVISVILEVYQNNKTLLSLNPDEKLPESHPAHQIYLSFHNLITIVTLAIFIEDDPSFVCHLLKLLMSILAHPCFVKAGSHALQPILNSILYKFLISYPHDPIYLNTITCYSALVSQATKHPGFAAIALTPEFNIISHLFSVLKSTSEAMAQNRNCKQNKVSDCTLFTETAQALSHFPTHYTEFIIEEFDSVIEVLNNCKDLDRKYSAALYKIIEETLKQMNCDKANKNVETEDDQENCEEEDEKENSSETPNASLPQQKVLSLYVYLEEMMRNAFESQDAKAIESSLSLLYYINEEAWETHYSKIKDILLSQLLHLNTIPTFKQSLLRLLGKICTFKQFYDYEGFSQMIFEIVTLNYNEKNTNTLIKNSWVLANLCANREACENFSLEINQELLFMSLAYCLSSKEKLTSNGFRALGYFITNNSDETLCKLATMESPKTEKIIEWLKEVYLRPFANSSVKVCWNVCVSLSNILKSFKPEFMNKFFNKEAFINVAKILETKNNYKAQIHCLEMLSLAYERYPDDICFTVLPKTLIQIYTDNHDEDKSPAENDDADSSEVRYLPHLRKNVESLLVTLLSDINITKSAEIFREMLDSPQALAEILLKYKNDLSENNKFAKTIPSIENISPLNFNDEDGRQTSTLQDLDAQYPSEWEELRDKLRKIQVLCEKLCEFVESCEDLIIPFSVCFKFEVLANDCREQIEAM